MLFAQKRCGFEEGGGKKDSFVNQLLSKTQDCLILLEDGFSEKMIKTAPYDLELQILSLACFHSLSMENNGSA